MGGGVAAGRRGARVGRRGQSAGRTARRTGAGGQGGDRTAIRGRRRVDRSRRRLARLPLGAARSRDRKTLATGIWDGSIRFWDLANSPPPEFARIDLPYDAGGHVCCLSYSPDGSRLAVGSAGTIVNVYEGADGHWRRVAKLD